MTRRTFGIYSDGVNLPISELVFLRCGRFGALVDRGFESDLVADVIRKDNCCGIRIHQSTRARRGPVKQARKRGSEIGGISLKGVCL